MREAAGAAGVEPGELTGIGVGSPGLVDEKTGVVREARQPARVGGRVRARALR